MTILEAIKSNPVFSEVSENHINQHLLSRSIDGSAEYNASSLKNVELVSADIYLDLSLVPNYKEGSLSVTYDVESLKKRALIIYQKYNDEKATGLGYRKIDLSITPKE